MLFQKASITSKYWNVPEYGRQGTPGMPQLLTNLKIEADSRQERPEKYFKNQGGNSLGFYRKNGNYYLKIKIVQ
ncbi:MAG: hypothetical protein U0U46_15145 [Saprospiraceae bacterium]